MANDNYLSDPNNPFFSLEDDIDDETFLNSAPPRSGHTTYNQYNNFDNVLEQKHQQLLQRKKEIEERTIQSTKRSISILRDSEQIGAATAEVTKNLTIKLLFCYISLSVVILCYSSLSMLI